MKLARKPVPVGSHTVATFIDQQIEWTGKPVGTIAEEVGFPKANILSMIRHGKTKLPINKIPAMARALEVDSAFLLNLVMKEYDPTGWSVIQEANKRPTITANELGWIEVLRTVDKTDPAVPENAAEGLKKLLGIKEEA